MFTLLAVVLILCTLYFHEIFHALAMLRNGIQIEEVGLGFPVWRIRGFKIRISGWFGGVQYVAFHPFLIGAYVRPVALGEAQIEALSYDKRCEIYGAGVWGNAIFALMLFAIRTGLAGGLIMAGAAVILILFIYSQQRILSAYVLPVIGIATIGLFIYSMVFVSADVYGPIGIIQLAHTVSTDFSKTFLFAEFISINLALVNTLPLVPLDGGRIFELLIEKCGSFVSGLYTKISIMLLIALFVWVFARDLMRLF